MANKVNKNAAYWRWIVAAGATISSHVVTQFSPDGFADWLGQRQWFTVDFGALRLTHNDKFVFWDKQNKLTQRKKYAFRSAQEALAALRKCVSPDEPSYAEIIEAVYSDDSKASP